MSNLAKSGVGASVSVGSGTSTITGTAIAEIKSFGGPNLAREEVDASTLDGGGVKQSIPGLKDYGNLDLDMLFTKATLHTQLRGDVEAGTQRSYKISWPTSPATTAVFTGLPLTWSQNTEPNAPLSAKVGIKINSTITWT